MFSSNKPKTQVLREEKGRLTGVDQWPFVMPHEICSTCSTWPQIKKDGIIQTSLVVALEKIKGPAHIIHMVEGGHHLIYQPHHNTTPQPNPHLPEDRE